MITKTHWIRTDNTYPFQNLALEELLMLGVQPHECILYLWQNRHTVVIGRNQNCWKECRVAELEGDGGHLVRRLSGGGAVYHDMGNLNFTFLVREEDYDVDRQLSVIVEACRMLGIRAEKSGRNDITVDGQKFSGNAFYKTAGCCYHHGTLLLRVEMGNLGKFLNVSQDKLKSKGVDSVRSRVTNLCNYCPEITVDLMAEKLIEAFGKVYGVAAVPLPEDRIDKQRLAERTEFFASEEWRFGRKIQFTWQLSDRFAWGDFQLHIAADEGRIIEAKGYSDTMDCEFIGRLPDALTGVRFSSAGMAEAVRRAGGEDYAGMAGDIAEAILKENI